MYIPGYISSKTSKSSCKRLRKVMASYAEQYEKIVIFHLHFALFSVLLKLNKTKDFSENK